MLQFLSVSKCSSVMVEMCLSVLPTYFRPYGNLSLVEKRDANLNVLKTVLILGPSLRNCLVNVCNQFSVNLENFPKKSNLKYEIFSSVLLGSVSLGMFMIFLLKSLLTDLSIKRYFSLVTSCQLLVTSHWLLVTNHWLLVTSHQLLVMSYELILATSFQLILLVRNIFVKDIREKYLVMSCVYSC